MKRIIATIVLAIFYLTPATNASAGRQTGFVAPMQNLRAEAAAQGKAIAEVGDAVIALAGSTGYNLPLDHRIVPIGQEKFLVANLGSTSVKMELQDAQGNLLAKGATKGNIGDKVCNFVIEINNEKQTVENMKSHEDALIAFTEVIKPLIGDLKGIQAVFYKTVHGGQHRKDTFVLDEPTLRAMEATYLLLAPEHNKFYALGARVLEKLLPNAVHLGRFEPATHVDNTLESSTTSLPYMVTNVLGLDATGFHGSSFAYLIKRTPQMLQELNVRVDGNKTVMFHIGGSSSACMSEDGKSIETSMMGTPESGFTQGTRITGSNVNPQMTEFMVQAVTGLVEKYYANQLKALFKEVDLNKIGRYKNFNAKLVRLVNEAVSELVKTGTLKGKAVSYEEESAKGIKRLSKMKDIIVVDAVRQRINRMFTEESGLKGIAGIGTGDVEKIKQAADQGNEQAQLAYNILIAEGRGYLGNYILKLGGNADVIVFTAGTGENDAEFRSRVIGDGVFFGRQVIKLDADRNNTMVGGKEGIISADDSMVKVLVIKANEAATLVEDGLAKYREIISATGQSAGEGEAPNHSQSSGSGQAGAAGSNREKIENLLVVVGDEIRPAIAEILNTIANSYRLLDKTEVNIDGDKTVIVIGDIAIVFLPTERPSWERDIFPDKTPFVTKIYRDREEVGGLDQRYVRAPGDMDIGENDLADCVIYKLLPGCLEPAPLPPPAWGVYVKGKSREQLIDILETDTRLMWLLTAIKELVALNYPLSLEEISHLKKTIIVVLMRQGESKRPVESPYIPPPSPNIDITASVFNSIEAVELLQQFDVLEQQAKDKAENGAGAVLAGATGKKARALNAEINYFLRRVGFGYNKEQLQYPVMLDCTTSPRLKTLARYVLPTGAPFGFVVKTIREAEELHKMQKLPVVSMQECLPPGINIKNATEEQYRQAFLTAVVSLNEYLYKYHGEYAQFYTMQTDTSLLGAIKDKGIDITTLTLTSNREVDTNIIVDWFNDMLKRPGIVVKDRDAAQKGLRALAVAV